MKILVIGRFIAVVRVRRISMAAVVIFKAHLICRLMSTRLVVSATGVALGEVTVGKIVLSKEFNVLECRAVVERVTSSVTCKARTTSVKWLSSAKGVHMFVRQISVMFKAVRNSDGVRIVDIAVCVGDLDVIDRMNDDIRRFCLCGCRAFIARAGWAAIISSRTTLRDIWLLKLWRWSSN